MRCWTVLATKRFAFAGRDEGLAVLEYSATG